jgi:hypothetical protein
MQVPLRNASLTVAAAFGLRLLSYEGSLVGIPADDSAINVTTGTIIMANRADGYGAVMQYDYKSNWAALGGGEFNFFALSSQYGEDTPLAVFQWGLAEDLTRSNASVKYRTMESLAAGMPLA